MYKSWGDVRSDVKLIVLYDIIYDDSMKSFRGLWKRMGEVSIRRSRYLFMYKADPFMGKGRQVCGIRIWELKTRA